MITNTTSQKHYKEVIKILEEAPLHVNHPGNMDKVLQGITPLAIPTDHKFDYPIDKKRTKQTTEKMITAEKNLDLFWAKFDSN